MSRRVSVRRHVRRRASEPPFARALLPPTLDPTTYGVKKVKAGRTKVFVKSPGKGGSMMPPDIAPRGEFQIGVDTRNESAASTLDDLLGFDIVPATALRAQPVPERPLGRPRGLSVQRAIPNARTLGSIYDAAGYDPEIAYDADIAAMKSRLSQYRDDFVKIAVFDIIVSADDRHAGNVIVDGRRAYAIDNEAIMEAPYGDIPTFHAVYKLVEGEVIPSRVRSALRNLTKEDFYAAFAGVPTENIAAAWQRKQWIETKERVPTRGEVNRLQ